MGSKGIQAQNNGLPWAILRYIAILFCLAAVNYLGASLGKAIALPPSNITPLWPPSGIALAALLLLGYRFFPGVWLGSFLFNTIFYWQGNAEISPTVLCSCAVLASASTLQALCGAYLSKKISGHSYQTWNLDAFLKTLLVGGPLCCLIASTIGTTTLYLSGAIPWNSSFINTWVIWWFGDTTGVIIFTGMIVGLVHIIKGQQEKSKDLHTVWHTISVMVILLSLGATLWGWYVLQEHTELENRNHFNKLVNDAENSVKNRLMSYQDALHGGAGFFYASNDVNKDEWKTYVKSLNIKTRYPGIMGMGYIAYVPKDKTRQFIAFARKNIQPDFSIKKINQGQYADSFIVQYFESVSTNAKSVIGLDIGSEPSRRIAAEAARDSKLDQVTSIIHLVQNTDKLPAFLLLVPVYQHIDVANTLESHRKNIKGWVYAPFAGQYIFDGILPKARSEIAFSVYDDAPNPQLIYGNIPANNNPLCHHSVQHKFEFAGHRWLISWQTTSNFQITPSSSQATFVLVFGLTLTLLLGALLVLLNTARDRALQYAKRMTFSLEEMNNTLQERHNVLMHAVEGIAQFDSEARFISLNKACTDLTGYTSDEIVGKSWKEIVPLCEVARIESLYKEMKLIGKASAETIGIRKDGREYVAEIVLVANVDQDQQFKGHFCFLKDISDKKAQEYELKASEERFRNSIEYSPIGMALVAVDGKWLQVNNALCQLTGYTKEELLKTDFQTITHPDDLEADLAQVQKMLSGEIETYQMEKRYIHKKGHVVWVQLNVSFVLDNDQMPLYFIAQIQDITQRRKMESNLHEARILAEQSSCAKSEFLANMSHEIRTPMNGILGMTDIVLNSSLTHEQRQQLEMVKSSGRSLMTIINDILDFSKIEAGKLDLDPIPFKLRDCIRDVIYPFTKQASDKNLELLWRIKPDVPNSLVGDPGRLRQILNNLLSNALKFTNHGDVMLTISVNSSNPSEAELQFCISDTGIGLPIDKQQVIFEPFSQADGSTARRYGGTGLGLSICLSLVEMMKGKMWLESEQGKGSQFYFTATLEVTEEMSSVIPVSPETLMNVPVLVVEDNATSRQVFNEFLKDWNMSPTLVRNGETAIEFLQHSINMEHPYELILLDVGLPGMDGFDIARVIKFDDRLKNTKIILLTSHAQPGDGALCRTIGIDAYLPKPVAQDELLKVIQRVFGLAVPEIENIPTDRLVTRHTMVEERASLSILLAEDNEVNQAIALHILGEAGYNVTIANNGREAVNKYLAEPFDIVLMDVQMPEMDGYSATKAIREYEEAKHKPRVPIIALTANAMKGDREKCLEASMDDYISKPFNQDEVLAIIKKLGAAI